MSQTHRIELSGAAAFLTAMAMLSVWHWSSLWIEISYTDQ